MPTSCRNIGLMYRSPASRTIATVAMGIEKITISANVPAYEIGEKSHPAVIVIEVSSSKVLSNMHHSSIKPYAMHRNGGV